jgi:hypothetical protein
MDVKINNSIPKDYIIPDHVFEHRRKEFDKILKELNNINQ